MARKRKASHHRSDFGHFDELGQDYRRFRYPDGHGGELSEYHHCTMAESELRRAELKLEYLRAKSRRGGRGVVHIPTVGEVWTSYVLPDYESRVTKSALANFRSAWRKLEPDWGHTKVTAIVGIDFEHWIADNCAESAAKRCVIVMRAITSRARAMGVIDIDPLDYKIKLPQYAKRDAETTVDDVDAYIKAVSKDDCILGGTILMLAGGCRFGEALAVRADSVSWDGKRAVFTISDEVRPNGELAGRLKTKASHRTSSITGKLGRRLHKLAAAALKRGDVYVCGNGIGGTVTQTMWRKHYRAALDAAGLEYVTPRALRPSWATAMLDAGASARAVNVSMGHTATSQVLATNYDRPDSSNAPVLPRFPSKSV